MPGSKGSEWTRAEASVDVDNVVTIIESTMQTGVQHDAFNSKAASAAYGSWHLQDTSIEATADGFRFNVFKVGKHIVEMMQAHATEYWLRYLVERKPAQDQANESRLTRVAVFSGVAFDFTHRDTGDATTYSMCEDYFNKLFSGKRMGWSTFGEDLRSESVKHKYMLQSPVPTIWSPIGDDTFSYARGMCEGTELFALRIPHKLASASPQALSLLASTISIGVPPSTLCLLNAILSPRPFAPTVAPWSSRLLETSIKTIVALGGGPAFSGMVRSIREKRELDPSVTTEGVDSKFLAALLLQLACDGGDLPELKPIIEGSHTATPAEEKVMLQRALEMAILPGERTRKYECIQVPPRLRDGKEKWNGERNDTVVSALNEDGESNALKLLLFTNSLMAEGQTLANVPRKEMEEKLERSIATLRERITRSKEASQNGGGSGGGGNGGGGGDGRRQSNRASTKDKSEQVSKAADGAAAKRANRIEEQRIPTEDLAGWDINLDQAKATLLDYFTLYDCDHLFELQRARRAILIAQIRITRLEYHGLCLQAVLDFIDWLSSPPNLRLLASLLNQVKGRAESKRLEMIVLLAAEVLAKETGPGAADVEQTAKRAKRDVQSAGTATTVTLPAAAAAITTYTCADGTDGAEAFREWLKTEAGSKYVKEVVRAGADCLAFLEDLQARSETRPKVYQTTVKYLIEAIASMQKFTEDPITALGTAHIEAAAVLTEEQRPIPNSGWPTGFLDEKDAGEEDRSEQRRALSDAMLDASEDGEDLDHVDADTGESDDGGGEHDVLSRARWKARRLLKKKHGKALSALREMEARIEIADVRFTLGTAAQQGQPSWWSSQKCCVHGCKRNKLNRYKCKINRVSGYRMCNSCAHAHFGKKSETFQWELRVCYGKGGVCGKCSLLAEEGTAVENSGGGGAAAAGN